MGITRLATILLLVLFLGGCGTTTSAPPVVSSLADNPADEFGTAVGTDWEITQLVTDRASSTLTVRVTFSSAPSIPPAGSSATSTDVAGYIDIDSDQNAATGIGSNAALFCPSAPGMSDEFYVYLFTRTAAGGYDIYDATITDVGDATPSISGNTLSISIPLSALLGDGQTNLAAVMGNSVEPTDCAPDSGALITRRPAGTVRWGDRLK